MCRGFSRWRRGWRPVCLEVDGAKSIAGKRHQRIDTGLAGDGAVKFRPVDGLLCPKITGGMSVAHDRMPQGRFSHGRAGLPHVLGNELDAVPGRLLRLFLPCLGIAPVGLHPVADTYFRRLQHHAVEQAPGKECVVRVVFLATAVKHGFQMSRAAHQFAHAGIGKSHPPEVG